MSYRAPGFLLTALLALCLALPGRAALRGPSPASPLLSVGIQLGKRQVKISGTHGFGLVDPASGRTLHTGWGGQAHAVVVDARPAGLAVKGHTGLPRLLVEPRQGGFVTVDGKSYRGTFELKADGKGRLNVVNWVPTEDYLYGVIKAEMMASSPLEALKAQAVAARTYALLNRDAFQARGYGLKANEQSQMYGGVGSEDPRTSRAVDETRGVVMIHDGKLIMALYSSACGGATENNEDVWRAAPVPYQRSVVCPGCQDAPQLDWTTRFDYQTIRQRLMAFQWDVPPIQDIAFTRTRTGRVKDVLLQTSKGTVRVPGNNFRLIVDRRAIKSLKVAGPDHGRIPPRVAARDMEPGSPAADDSAIRNIIGSYMRSEIGTGVLELRGRGAGHGVGMCQHGAAALARSGRSCRAILTHYYRGIQLRRAYA